LKIQSRLNGQVMQDANTRDMVFGVAETICLISECMTFDPGDILVMGTPGGVGAARKPPVFMKPGDVCEIEIGSVGVLRNFRSNRKAVSRSSTSPLGVLADDAADGICEAMCVTTCLPCANRRHIPIKRNGYGRKQNDPLQGNSDT